MADDSFARATAAITRLICEYAERIDSGNLEGVADLLEDAGFGEGTGGLLHGRDDILAIYKKTVRIYDDGTPCTKHLVSNITIHVDDEFTTATARSYWTVLQAVPGSPPVVILSGRYADRFVNWDSKWRFSERRITTDLFGDTSGHMLPGGPSLEPR